MAGPTAETTAETTVINSRRDRPLGRVPGSVVAVASVAFVTALIYPVKLVAPAMSAGVIYLLAVLLVASVWGLRLGLFTALLSALAFNWFHIPPTGNFTIGGAENWVALAVFAVTAIVVSSITELSRSRAIQAERRRREADLAFELARLFSAPPAELAVVRAAALIGEALELADVQIVLGRVASEGPKQWILRSDGISVAALIVGGQLDDDQISTLDLAVVPALAALVGAALERDALTDAHVEREALRRSDEIKTSLLRAVSHDLRTPLMAISAAGEALQSHSIDSHERDELAASFSEQAGRLNALVTKLLDLSRLQAGEVDPRHDWCAIDELVQAAIDQATQPDRIELKVDQGVPLVRADGALLERAFANLIDNALRYSVDQPVTATVRRSGDHVRVRVIDRGPGIADADLETIFAPFQRGEVGGEGAGLGLAIVRGMVEANDGTVWAESLPGQGATFVVDLPAERVPSALHTEVAR